MPPPACTRWSRDSCHRPVLESVVHLSHRELVEHVLIQAYALGLGFQRRPCVQAFGMRMVILPLALGKVDGPGMGRPSAFKASKQDWTACITSLGASSSVSPKAEQPGISYR